MLEDIDMRTDVPRYRLWNDGILTKELDSLKSEWRTDLVTFVLGCSFSFEESLIQAGIPMRHIEMNRNVPMYNTNIPNEKAGIFGGNLVVSMRPLTKENAAKATEITKQFSKFHGAPIH